MQSVTLPPETPPDVPEPPGYAEARDRLARLMELYNARDPDAADPSAPQRAMYGSDWKALVKAELTLVYGHDAVARRRADPDYLQGWADCRAAALALNPGAADDGEPVTSEWIGTILSVRPGYGAVVNDLLSFFATKHGWRLYFTNGEGDSDATLLAPVATRGDVRRLVLALGGQLKGGAQ